ncbi:hypothetical protein [Nocardioides sp.]|uniref:hypothetical protein n=1 Tax=Nocardioides sp. TaxID=35761 RepID=UPI00378352E1
MTTTPQDPDTVEPEVVPSSDPDGTPNPISPGEDPGVAPDTLPLPETDPDVLP